MLGCTDGCYISRLLQQVWASRPYIVDVRPLFVRWMQEHARQSQASWSASVSSLYSITRTHALYLGKQLSGCRPLHSQDGAWQCAPQHARPHLPLSCPSRLVSLGLLSHLVVSSRGRSLWECASEVSGPVRSSLFGSLFFLGHCTAGMASDCFISVLTVKHHLATILRILASSSQAVGQCTAGMAGAAALL